MELLIKRINQLYKKSQEEGLTACEREEQAKLRQEYIARFKQSFINTLDNTVVLQPDGTKTPVKRSEKKRYP